MKTELNVIKLIKREQAIKTESELIKLIERIEARQVRNEAMINKSNRTN